MERLALPLFVRVTVCAALVVPTVCEPKAMDVGETETAGAVVPPPPLPLEVEPPPPPPQATRVSALTRIDA